MNNKFLFYCSDFHGIGHFTRTSIIVNYLARQYKKGEYLLITNKYILPKAFPPNVKIIILPPVSINTRPRDCRYQKELPWELNEWSEILNKIVLNFKPDVFYSDLNPCGGYGELRLVLPNIKKNGIKCILGLRDILDGPRQTKKEWMNKGKNILSIYDYDELLVFGEKELFMSLYSPYIKNVKISFVGPPIIKKQIPAMKKEIDILGVFGGGGKSKEQVEYLAKILSSFDSKKIVIIVGPLFPKKSIEELRKNHPWIRFVRETTQMEKFMSKSKLVITHCGNNCIWESVMYCGNVISFPRLKLTRKEQSIKSKYLKKKYGIEYLNYNFSEKKNTSLIKRKLKNSSTTIPLPGSALNERLMKYWKK